MACRIIHNWTFCSLVGAFLDLSLAYLLLGGSALAFFTEKLLSMFGLYLPCGCNGLFGNPDSTRCCIHRILVDTPPRLISSVNTSARNRFPYDEILMKDENSRPVNVKLGLLKMNPEEDEEVGSSTSHDVHSSRRLRISEAASESEEIELEPRSSNVTKGSIVEKVKKKAIQKFNPGIRHRRRASVRQGDSFIANRRQCIGNEPSSFSASYDITESWKEATQKSLEDEVFTEVGTHGNILPPSFSNCNVEVPPNVDPFGGKGRDSNMDASFNEESVSNYYSEFHYDSNAQTTIKMLEHELEEEHVAQKALYLELEEERNAAAIAANEAMAMILRLQKEKASIEMEARQYQRLVEEKSAYDEEEMNLLKEILLRREREKHVLEKEVEIYRDILAIGGRCDPYQVYQNPHDMLNFIDQVPITPQMGEVGRKEEYADKSLGSRKRSDYLIGKIQGDVQHLPMYSNETGFEFQEKGMVSSQDNKQSFSDDCKVDNPNLDDHDNDILRENTIHLLNEDKIQRNISILCNFETENVYEKQKRNVSRYQHDDKEIENIEKVVHESGAELCTSMIDFESTVLDVHVVDCNKKICNQQNTEEYENIRSSIDDSINYSLLPESCTGENVDGLMMHPNEKQGNELKPWKSFLDTKKSMCKENLQNMPSLPAIGRSSMSEIDHMRLKLDNEVGCLRERLRIVHEGREKLSLSIDHPEKEKFQLQLLEELVSQLQEIRKLTEPKAAARQKSLPPSSSKVNTKKRRCRNSSSWGCHDSA